MKKMWWSMMSSKDSIRESGRYSSQYVSASKLVNKIFIMVAISIVALVVLDSQAVEAAQCAASPPGLVSWWNGQDGNTNDVLSKNNGVPMGGLSFVAGKVGDAFSFDGVDDYIEIVDDPSLTPAAFTISTWIKLEEVISRKTIISKEGSASSLVLIADGSKLYFGVIGIEGKGMHFTSQDNVLTAGVWYHVAVTYDTTADTMKMYVNNQEIPTVKGFIGLGAWDFYPPADNNDPLRIGVTTLNGELYAPFKGIIDEVAFWNVVLTAEQVSSIYTADSVGICALPQLCGNGKLEAGEQCDGNLNLFPCDFVGGFVADNKVVSCKTDCTYDTSMCTPVPTCSDGVQNGDETSIDCGGSICPACGAILPGQLVEDPLCTKIKDKPVVDKSLIDGMAGALGKATKLQKIAAMVNAIKAWLAAQP